MELQDTDMKEARLEEVLMRDYEPVVHNYYFGQTMHLYNLHSRTVLLL